jgi:hypothetical protein
MEVRMGQYIRKWEKKVHKTTLEEHLDGLVKNGNTIMQVIPSRHESVGMGSTKVITEAVIICLP